MKEKYIYRIKIVEKYDTTYYIPQANTNSIFKFLFKWRFIIGNELFRYNELMCIDEESALEVISRFKIYTKKRKVKSITYKYL